MAGPSTRLVGKSWPSGLISPRTTHSSNFPSGTVAFKKVVAPAQAILGKSSIEFPLLSGWSQKDININDPIEVALASRLQDSALAHVAASTSKAYVGPWNAYILWCGALLRPRRPLPADDITVALYLQSLMDTAKSFSTIKSASASIAFFHKINLFTNHPTGAPEVSMVGTAAARKFGLSPKRVKKPFLWFQLVNFALLYGIHNQGYSPLVVATMALLSFGDMCRYSDVSQLKWGNVHFESELSSFVITFETRKNFQFRQGNKVTVAATNNIICPLKLLLKLKHSDVNATSNGSIFCGFKWAFG